MINNIFKIFLLLQRNDQWKQKLNIYLCDSYEKRFEYDVSIEFFIRI